VELKAIHENCSGCGVCRLVCALENFWEVNPSKAALRIEGRFPAPGDYRIHLCNQCGQCAEACPVEAIRLENHAYIIDADECTGCMLCVNACPLGVMFEHKKMTVPIKCTLCGECVEACPREALQLTDPRVPGAKGSSEKPDSTLYRNSLGSSTP
jgi:Fe-S-cluster-containing hydrogenase component 2